jgi:hypothetical protein
MSKRLAKLKDGTFFMHRPVFLTLAILIQLPCFGLVSTNVPLTHWSYDTLEVIANAGLIHSDLLSTKPFSRQEMARLVLEAQGNIKEENLEESFYGQLLKRLETEFAYDIETLASNQSIHPERFLKPLEDPYVRLVDSDKPPEYENQQGDRFSSGANVRTGFSTRGQLSNWAAFYLHPEFEGPSSQNKVELIEGYGKVGVGPMSVQMGKDSIWWGPGHHGSLIMTSNAEPLTMIKVANDQPIILPGFMKFLGPIRSVFFLTELDSGRTIPDAKLTGLRTNFKPTPDFEVGFNRTIMFGGKGGTSTNAKDYLQIYWPKNLERNSSQLASFDVSWRLTLPKYLAARAVKFYGEFASEESGFAQLKPLVGIQFIDLLRQGGKTDLRLEYAETFRSQGSSSFYQHGVYGSGYTYEGRVLGHHMGTGSRDLFGHLTHWLNPSLRFGLSFNRMESLISAPRPRTDQTGIDVLWFGPKNLQWQAQYRYESNQNQTATFNGDNHILDVRIGFRF